MGGMRKTMPVTFWVYMIGTLALAGIVPFAGFWSKDEILLDASRRYPAVYGLLTLAAFFTAFYMGRQILDGLLRRAASSRPPRMRRKARW